MGYRGEDMIGDDGYGTWDDERLDKEYRKLRTEKKALEAENERLKRALLDVSELCLIEQGRKPDKDEVMGFADTAINQARKERSE